MHGTYLSPKWLSFCFQWISPQCLDLPPHTAWPAWESFAQSHCKPVGLKINCYDSNIQSYEYLLYHLRVFTIFNTQFIDVPHKGLVLKSTQNLEQNFIALSRWGPEVNIKNNLLIFVRYKHILSLSPFSNGIEFF